MNCYVFDNTLSQIEKKRLGQYLSAKVSNYKITTTTYNTYDSSCILTMNK